MNNDEHLANNKQNTCKVEKFWLSSDVAVSVTQPIKFESLEMIRYEYKEGKCFEKKYTIELTKNNGLITK